MIIQINIFICEVCGKHISKSDVVPPWSDPDVAPPLGWDYVIHENKEKFACSDCVQNLSNLVEKLS